MDSIVVRAWAAWASAILIACAPRERPTERKRPSPGPTAERPASLSEVLRPGQVWVKANLRPQPLPLAHAGDQLFFAPEGSDDLVALDVRTGAERWRVATPVPRPQHACVVGGRIVLDDSHGKLVAHDVRDGKLAWEVETGCSFVEGLVGAGNRVAGLCTPRPAPGQPALALIHGEKYPVAFDVATGKQSWRGATAAGMLASLAVDPHRVYVLRGLSPPQPGRPPQGLAATVTAFDLASGRSVWTASAEQMPVRVAAAAGVAVAIGSRTQAFRAADGTLLWTADLSAQPLDPVLSIMQGGVAVHRGALLVPYADRIDALDLATGRLARTFTPPPTAAGVRRTVVRADDRRVVAWMSTGLEERGYLVLWEGRDARVLQSPPGSPARAVVLEDLVVTLVARPGTMIEDVLAAYSLARTEPAEATSLGAVERVRAVLGRAGDVDRLDRVPSSVLDEVRAIPDAAAQLAAIARDPSSPLRARAVVLLAAVAPAQAPAVLIALLDEPVPPHPMPPERLAMLSGATPTLDQVEKLQQWKPPPDYAEQNERYQRAVASRRAAIGRTSDF